jgi:acetyl/propionyl-CoA carboxylase alpha subunit
MRVVRVAADFEESRAAAIREAETAFGDGSVYCERYLERPRHVEVQLLVDEDDRVVVLGARDCSVQRRHQKIVEEAPPRLAAPARKQVEEAATAFASAIGYRNAGTAEFLVDRDDVYFLELNGRIQVEHPVTEAVYGVDLVELQLRVAEGRPAVDSPPSARGHAVEARLYAEDPVTFLPQAGFVDGLRLPSGIRVDTGIEEGDTIGTSYDPMVAKLIAHGRNRDEALAELGAALADTEVRGVTTNLPFLRWLVGHPVFRAGPVTTAFLVEHPPLSPYPRRTAQPVWLGAWRLNLPDAPPAPPPDIDTATHEGTSERQEANVTAPMPGTVLRVEVGPGDAVRARQPLLVLEAMKMETPVVSPFDATVKAVHVTPGDRVAGGALLVELA